MAPQHRLKWWERPLVRLAKSRPGGWFFVHVANRIDPALLRLSRGRLSCAIGWPVLLLTAKGARTGQQRATPLVYATDGDDVILIASNAGSARHPAWYRNVMANPEVTLLARGRSGPYRARQAEGEERERLWARAVDLYSGYETYQGRTGGREIPVIVLSPR